MYICYVDESGGFEAPNTSHSATPVMTFVGLVLPVSRVPAFTRDFLDLKRRHFPGRFTSGTGLSHVLVEIKGSEILQMTRATARNKRRQADRIRADLLALLEAHDARVLGRVWVKELTKGLAPIPSYCFAIQDIARHFSAYLVSRGEQGIMVCDAREQGQNIKAAHSVFTDKFRVGGDPTPAIVEIPLFGHSDNHAGLQASDLIASTFVFPMAVAAYCRGTVQGAHASPFYDDVHAKFGAGLRQLQYRYVDENGKWRGGVVVSDRLGKRSGAALFV